MMFNCFVFQKKKSFQMYLVKAAMQACIVNHSNFLHRPRSVVCSLKLRLSSMQVFKRIVPIEMSVLEKAGCTLLDLCFIAAHIYPKVCHQFLRTMEEKFRQILKFLQGNFSPSTLTLIWH